MRLDALSYLLIVAGVLFLGTRAALFAASIDCNDKCGTLPGRAEIHLTGFTCCCLLTVPPE